MKIDPFNPICNRIKSKCSIGKVWGDCRKDIYSAIVRCYHVFLENEKNVLVTFRVLFYLHRRNFQVVDIFPRLFDEINYIRSQKNIFDEIVIRTIENYYFITEGKIYFAKRTRNIIKT